MGTFLARIGVAAVSGHSGALRELRGPRAVGRRGAPGTRALGGYGGAAFVGWGVDVGQD